MSNIEPILFEQKGSIAVLTLNRPQTRNALSGEDMFSAFENIFARMNADENIAVAILTGAGPSFCSGGNVADMRDRQGMFAGSPEQIAENYRNGIQRIPRAFELLEVPIIAAVNGPAMGAGNDLSTMCDIRIASSAAKFAENFAKVGIIPGDGGCWLLPRVVGSSMAAELTFTGRSISAEEALRIGLVSKVVPPEMLMQETIALAEEMALNSSQVLRWTKQLLREAKSNTLGEALKSAADIQGKAHHGAAHIKVIQEMNIKLQQSGQR